MPTDTPKSPHALDLHDVDQLRALVAATENGDVLLSWDHQAEEWSVAANVKGAHMVTGTGPSLPEVVCTMAANINPPNPPTGDGVATAIDDRLAAVEAITGAPITVQRVGVTWVVATTYVSDATEATISGQAGRFEDATRALVRSLVEAVEDERKAAESKAEQTLAIIQREEGKIAEARSRADSLLRDLDGLS